MKESLTTPTSSPLPFPIYLLGEFVQQSRVSWRMIQGWQCWENLVYWQLISPCKILITHYPQVFHYPLPTPPSPQPTHTGERVVDRSHYILDTVKGEWLALLFENNQRKNSHTSSYPVSTLKMCLEIFPSRHERPIIKERVLFISVVGFLMSVPRWNLRRHLQFQL